MAGFNRELRETRQFVPVLCAWLLPELNCDYCAGRSEFFLRAEPERSEGGLSEEMKNREGVASGGATPNAPHQTPRYKPPEC